MPNSIVMPYAPVVLKLLQNPLFSDETASWNLLLANLTPVQEYFARIGLEVRLDEEDGYAYLHQPALEDDEGQSIALPRLTRRDRLTYSTTLLCVLLREWLDQFESTHLDAGKCTITDDQVRKASLRCQATAISGKARAKVARVCSSSAERSSWLRKKRCR